MAVITKDGKPVSQPSKGTTATEERVPLVTITLEELKKKSMLGPTVEMDLEEDAWGNPAPPPKGRYKLKLFIGQKGLQVGYNNPQNPIDAEMFITAGLQAIIVSDDPEVNGVYVFPSVSTRVFRGRNISTMIGLVVKGLGPKAVPKNNLNVYQQAELFTAFLKREPIVEADLDWRGSYQEVDGTWTNSLKKYEDFPDLEDKSGKEHEVEVTKKDGTSVTVKAQLQVAYWYGKGEADRETKKKANGAPVGGKPLEFVQSPAIVANKPQSASSTPVRENLPLGQTGQAVGGETIDEDMALMLGE